MTTLWEERIRIFKFDFNDQLTNSLKISRVCWLLLRVVALLIMLAAAEQLVSKGFIRAGGIGHREILWEQEPTGECFHSFFWVLPNFQECVYLTIRPVANKGLRVNSPWGKAECGWPNCFSITQLVGQKKAIIKLANASWRKIYLGIKWKNFATQWLLLIVL